MYCFEHTKRIYATNCHVIEILEQTNRFLMLYSLSLCPIFCNLISTNNVAKEIPFNYWFVVQNFIFLWNVPFASIQLVLMLRNLIVSYNCIFFAQPSTKEIFFPLIVKSCHKSVHKTSKWAEVKKHIKCAGKHMIGTLKLYFSRERLVSHFGLWVRFLFISNSLSARTDFFPHLLSFSRSFFLILQGGWPSP